MGNLHAGHLALAELAAAKADRVVVSVFVNPTQFGAQEDIGSYPRTLDADEGLLRQQGCADLLYVPAEKDVYPRGLTDLVMVSMPALATDLCGRSRPGHFNGVASVVLRLLNIVQPEVLVVGQKDYQQMVLLGWMIEDLHVPVELVAGPIVRDTDGLALSSRNQYLTSEERLIAPQLHATLLEFAAQLNGATDAFENYRPAALERLAGYGFKVDYLELRAAGDLAPLTVADGPSIVLVAAWLGRARLLDNILI